MRNSIFMLALALICAFSIPASAASREEQRASIQNMKDEVLNKLYQVQPSAEQEISKATGYAVFSSADLAAIFVSGSYGHGIAHENRTGNETYMQMASLGAGLGIGIKDFRAVFIFENPKAYQDFVTTGLDLSGHVDVAAKGGNSGGAITGAQVIAPGIKVYQLTEAGLMAQVMLKGTKYWRDNELNDFEKSSDAGTIQNR